MAADMRLVLTQTRYQLTSIARNRRAGVSPRVSPRQRRGAARAFRARSYGS